MSTSANLDSSSLRLAAGTEVVVPLQIRNNGEVVEGYRLEVVGPPAAWASVEPETVSLYPGSATTATVTFHPPKSPRVPAGELQFGVVVTPTEHPAEAVVPEGVIEVLPFFETAAELVPRTSQGRIGRHQVAVDNRGNVPVQVMLEGADDANQLRFRINPPAVTVPPGEARFVDVRLTPAVKVWRGAPRTHPFAIGLAPQDSQSVTLDGTYVQTALIPRWLPKLLLALLALLALLVALWFTVFRPTIESTAEKAVEDEVAAADKDARDAKDAAGSAKDSEDNAKDSEEKTGQDKKTFENFRDKLNLPPTATDVSRRLNVSTSATGSDQYDVADKTTFKLTDLVLSNPQGDFGTAQITRKDTDDVLFDMALENFRDLDFHFVSPIEVKAGNALVLRVRCAEPGKPPAGAKPTRCDISALLGGESIPVPKKKPEKASQ